jgi:hypothetical protein
MLCALFNGEVTAGEVHYHQRPAREHPNVSFSPNEAQKIWFGNLAIHYLSFLEQPLGGNEL